MIERKGKALGKYEKLPIQIKASFWFLICSFLQRGISIITTPIFTRLLTTAEYGQYTTFVSWQGVVAIFVTLGLSGGVYTRGLIKFEKERDAFTSSLQGLTILLTILWMIIYRLFQDFWNNLLSLSTVQVWEMFALIWFSAIYGFWAAEQRALYRYRALALITVVTSVLQPILSILFVLHTDDKVTARIAGMVIAQGIGYGGLFFAQMRKGKTWISYPFWKYAISFNLPLIPHYLSQMVLSSADRIMISRMVGESEAGIYGLSYSIAMIMTVFSTVFAQALTPWTYQKIKEKKFTDTADISYAALLFIAAINLVLIAAAPEIVTIFAPIEYHEAIWAIPPVVMSVFFMFTYDIYVKLAFYYEKTVFVMAASIGGAVLNIFLNYLLLPRFGYMAAGYTTLACYFMYSVMHFTFMNHLCDKYCDGTRLFSLRRISVLYVGFIAAGWGLMALYRMRVARYVLIILILGILIRQKDRWILKYEGM